MSESGDSVTLSLPSEGDLENRPPPDLDEHLGGDGLDKPDNGMSRPITEESAISHQSVTFGGDSPPQSAMLGDLSNFSMDLDDLADDHAFPARLTGRHQQSRPSTQADGENDLTLEFPSEFVLDDEMNFYDDVLGGDSAPTTGGDRFPDEVGGVVIKKQLVAKPMRHVKHPLVDRHVYSKIGKNDIVEAHPPILYFDGIHPDQVYVQDLKLTNISRKSIRLQLVEPATPFVKYRYNRKGLIAPGMSEVIQVEFIPHEYKYYHDSIRVHCAGDKLLVPIHAYPTMNSHIFPSAVKFGRCKLLQPATKTITMSNTVPLNFEFAITVREANKSFVIEPMNGVIPAHGKVDIAITFTPYSYSTTRLKMSVAVSQFNLKPIECEITASCAPDNQAIIETPETDKTLSIGHNSTANSKVLRGTRDPVEAFRRAERQAGRKDPFAPKPPKPSSAAARAEKADRMMLTQTGINKVLSGGTTAGRARVAQVKNERLQGDASRPGAGNTPLAIDGDVGVVKPGDTVTADTNLVKVVRDRADVAEMHFLRALNQSVEAEKAKEIKAHVSIGQPLLGLSDIKEIKRRRTKLRVQELAYDKSVAMSTVENVHSDVPVVAEAHQSLPARPSFNLLRSQSAADRMSMFSRFMRVLQTHLIRVRADIRLRKIRVLLKSVGYDKDRLRELVQAQASMITSVADRDGSGGDSARRGGAASASALAAVDLEPVEQPRVFVGDVRMFRASDFSEPKQVPVEDIPLFEDCPTFPLRVAQEYKIKGYRDLAFPPAGSYNPLTAGRDLRTGAEDEYPDRAPRGEVLPTEVERQRAPLVAPPAAVLAMPQVPPNEYLLPSKPIATYTPAIRHTEVDIDFALRPRVPPPETGVLAHEQPLGTTAILALADQKTLSDVWLGKYEHPHLDALPRPDPTLPERVDTTLGDDSDEESDDDELPPLPHPDDLISEFKIPPSSSKRRIVEPETERGEGDGVGGGVRFAQAAPMENKFVWRTLRQECETKLQEQTREQRLRTASMLSEVAAGVRSAIRDPFLRHSMGGT